MFGLRKINNLYSEHAGTRSDFVIVGHPEFNFGKVRTESGIGKDWDTSRCLKPRKSVARSRSLSEIANQMAYPKPWQSLKDGNTLRKQRATVRGSNSSLERNVPKTKVTLDMFLDDLKASGASPSQTATESIAADPMSWARKSGQVLEPARSASSALGPDRWSAVVRHHLEDEETLANIRERFQRNPDAVRRELEKKGHWKYYIQYMDSSKRLEEDFHATRRRNEPNMKFSARPPVRASLRSLPSTWPVVDE